MLASSPEHRAFFLTKAFEHTLKQRSKTSPEPTASLVTQAARGTKRPNLCVQFLFWSAAARAARKLFEASRGGNLHHFESLTGSWFQISCLWLAAKEKCIFDCASFCN